MSRTILLADDSVTIQKVIELTFMDEDYEVVAVGNGDDALEQLDEIRPDFVIADVHMPGANGYDVAKHAKSLQPDVPVLLLVGTFEPFDEELAEKSGCDAYLKKPFDSQELQRLVEELSAGPASEAAGESPLEATGWRAQTSGQTSSETEPPPSAPPGSEASGATGEGSARGEEPDAAGAEESKAEPFSLGSFELDEEEPPPTRVEPPEDGAAPDDSPVFEDLPETPEGAESGPRAGGEEPDLAVGAEPDAPTEPEAVETPPPAPEEVAAESAPPAAAEASDAASEAPEQAPVASEAAPPEGPGGPLSDEDVDRIARRILQILGDGPIRDVAWEVVPDMAEVVIRSRLRELETQVETVE